MEEKIKAPTTTNEVHQTASDAPKKVEETPKDEVGGKTGEYEKLTAKDPNYTGVKRAFNHDGSYRQYVLNQIPQNDHLFQEVRQTLGLVEEDDQRYRNEIAEATKMVAEYLQSDDHERVNNFVRLLLRRIPTTGNRVHNFLVELKKEFNKGLKPSQKFINSKKPRTYET